MKKVNDNMQPVYNGPIKCPICQSINIAFVTEYHKCIILKLVNNLIIAFAIVALVYYFITDTVLPNSDDNFKAGVASGISFICYLVVAIIIYVTESKTHVQGICRDCGNIWLLN